MANCVRRRTGFAKFSQAPDTPAHSEQVHNPGANPDRTNCGLEVGREALVNENANHWKSMTWKSGGRRVDSIRVVALGASKRVVPGAFCGFEFVFAR